MQVSHSVPKPAAETCIANPSPAAGGGFINPPTSADVFCAECGCYHTGGECSWCADKQTTAHIIKILRGYGVLYMATAPNGKSYIGQTTDFAKRQSKHLCGKGECLAFNAAIAKYGRDSIKWQIIGTAANQTELDGMEIAAIAKHNTMSPNGYNLREGGKGGKDSAQTRANKKAAAMRPEVRAAKSRALMGHAVSQEQRDKQAAKMIGRKANPQTRARMTASQLKIWAARRIAKGLE